MSNRAQTYLIRNGSQNFATTAVDMQQKKNQITQTAASLDEGKVSWKGDAADAYQRLSELLEEDLDTARKAFESVSHELSLLAVQWDQINQFRDQADQLQNEILTVEHQLWGADDQERASLHHELSNLQYRHSSLVSEANSLEWRLQSDASAKFHEIANQVNKLHVVQGIPSEKELAEQKREEDIFSWSSFAMPGVISGLILTKGIKFRPSATNPRVVIISTGEWLRGRAGIEWWDNTVKFFNRHLFGRFPKMLDGSFAKKMKDMAGISTNLTRISVGKLPAHLAKRALGPVGIAWTVGSEVKPLYDSYEQNKDKDRHAFWRNFTKDAASSVNRVVWNSAGTVAGTAAGAAAGSFLGPAGSVVGGAIGGTTGGMAGDWVALKTDGFAQEAGEHVGEWIADGLDKVDELKEKVHVFDLNLKKSFSPLF